MKQPKKWWQPQNEDDLKNYYNLKNEGDLKNEDNFYDEEHLKIEDKDCNLVRASITLIVFVFFVILKKNTIHKLYVYFTTIMIIIWIITYHINTSS